jgi:hypothetical protein
MISMQDEFDLEKVQFRQQTLWEVISILFQMLCGKIGCNLSKKI